MNYGFYVLGQLVNFWLKTSIVINSPKNTTAYNYTTFIKRYWAVILFRFCAATAFFILWNEVGSSTFGSDYMPVKLVGSTHAKAAVALLCGLAADSFVDKVGAKLPWFKDDLPHSPYYSD